MPRQNRWALALMPLFVLFSSCVHPTKQTNTNLAKANEAQNLQDNTAQAESKPIQIRAGYLDNGLKLLFLRDNSAPVVSVQIWYRVGSRDEKDGLRGMAHLLEHMMFKGTENIAPGDYANIITSIGGSLNAFTAEDMTAYHCTIPAERLDLVMAIEAERMSRLKFDPSHFAKEREVVKEEIRMRYQNDPIGHLRQIFNSLAFTKHPYQYGVGGTLTDLNNIGVEDIRAFWKTYYAPNNAVLVVVGDSNWSEVQKLAQKNFGPIKKQPLPPPVNIVEPEQTQYRQKTLTLQTQLPFIMAGFKVPEASHPDAPVLEVIERILSQGKSSRLHRALVRQKQLAMFVGASDRKMLDPGVFLFYASYKANPQEVEKALLEEIQKLTHDGPTPDELKKARNQLTASHIFKLTSLDSVGFNIGFSEVVEKDYHQFIKGASAYDKISADDIKRVMAKYFTRNRLTVAILSPGKSPKKETAQAKDTLAETAKWETAKRFKVLDQPSPDPIELPRISRKQLDNGLRLMVIERREQPVIYFDLILPGGKSLESIGKAGAADLLASLLTQGTKNRSAEEIAYTTDSMGGSISADAGQERFWISGAFLSRDLGRALELFADIVLHPTFPEDELMKLKPQHESMLRRNRDMPTALAVGHLNYLVFGYQHPQGRPASVATLKAVTSQDIREVYRLSFRPNDAIMAVTGDVDPDLVLDVLEKQFASWKKQDNSIALPDDPPPLKGQTIRLVDNPDLTQATVVVGHLGIDIKDDTYIPTVLGNFVLGGGGLTSRLMQSIRTKGGKSYTAGSSMHAGKKKGIFRAFTFTRTSETRSTIELLLNEIQKIRTKGVTQKELLAAKNNLVGNYVIKLQPAWGMADRLLSAEFYGFGEEYVRNYRSLIVSPTLAEVNQALARNLSSEDLAMVIVGNAKEIQEQVKGLAKPQIVGHLEAIPDEERKTDTSKKSPKKVIKKKHKKTVKKKRTNKKKK